MYFDVHFFLIPNYVIFCKKLNMLCLSNVFDNLLSSIFRRCFMSLELGEIILILETFFF